MSKPGNWSKSARRSNEDRPGMERSGHATCSFRTFFLVFVCFAVFSVVAGLVFSVGHRLLHRVSCSARLSQDFGELAGGGSAVKRSLCHWDLVPGRRDGWRGPSPCPPPLPPPRVRRTRGASRVKGRVRQPSRQQSASLSGCTRQDQRVRVQFHPVAEGRGKRLQESQSVPEPREFARRFDGKKQGLGIPFSSRLPRVVGAGLGIPISSRLPEVVGAGLASLVFRGCRRRNVCMVRSASLSRPCKSFSLCLSSVWLFSAQFRLFSVWMLVTLCYMDVVNGRRGGGEVGALVPPRRRSGASPLRKQLAGTNGRILLPFLWQCSVFNAWFARPWGRGGQDSSPSPPFGEDGSGLSSHTDSGGFGDGSIAQFAPVPQ